jgi:Ca-activated chloride channel homolog
MRIEFPWAFLALPLLVLLVWLSVHKRRRPGLKFSSVAAAASSGTSFKARARYVPLAARTAAVLLLTIGLARPQQGREEVLDLSQGVAIEMVVDRSGSMGQEFIYDGAQLTRLDAVKKIFKEFVLGNGKDLRGRATDLIGMVDFARYADTICPLTLSHGALERFIESIQLVARKNEDGTAIGDALALAAARLKTAEESLKSGRPKRSPPGPDPQQEKTGATLPPSLIAAKDYRIKSKVIILLTDGQNNFGKHSPMEAARLAKEWGIKVYAVGIGGRESFATIKTPFGNYKVPGGPGVDEATLKAIAEETGGAFWLAESGEKLQAIYKEIDRLERTDIESVRHVDYAEKFFPFAFAALILLSLEQILTNTYFRRLP